MPKKSRLVVLSEDELQLLQDALTSHQTLLAVASNAIYPVSKINLSNVENERAAARMFSGEIFRRWERGVKVTA